MFGFADVFQNAAYLVRMQQSRFSLGAISAPMHCAYLACSCLRCFRLTYLASYSGARAILGKSATYWLQGGRGGNGSCVQCSILVCLLCVRIAGKGSLRRARGGNAKIRGFEPFGRPWGSFVRLKCSRLLYAAWFSAEHTGA